MSLSKPRFCLRWVPPVPSSSDPKIQERDLPRGKKSWEYEMHLPSQVMGAGILVSSPDLDLCACRVWTSLGTSDNTPLDNEELWELCPQGHKTVNSPYNHSISIPLRPGSSLPESPSREDSSCSGGLCLTCLSAFPGDKFSTIVFPYPGKKWHIPHWYP